MYQDCLKIYILPTQTFDTFVQVEINKDYIDQALRIPIYWQDWKTLGPEEADLKEKAHKISSEIAKFLQKLPKLLPHVVETLFHLWDH